MPDQNPKTPGDPEGLTRPSIDAVMQRLNPGGVRARDLSQADDDRTVLHDLISLDFGTPEAKVSVLGTLNELVEIVATAAACLGQVRAQREEAGQ